MVITWSTCVLSVIIFHKDSMTASIMKKAACELSRKAVFNFTVLAARVECVLVEISALYYVLSAGAAGVTQTMWSSES